MKRTLALILSLILILTAVPAMASTANDFAGTWVYSQRTDDGWIIEILLLAPNGTAYYMNRSFSGKEVGFGREFVGRWSFSQNDAYIVYGNNADGFFKLNEEKTKLTSADIAGLVFYRVER